MCIRDSVYSLPFDSKLSLCGTRGSRFYLLKGNKTLLTVDAATGDCKKTALSGTVCALTPDVYVTRSGKTLSLIHIYSSSAALTPSPTVYG